MCARILLAVVAAVFCAVYAFPGQAGKKEPLFDTPVYFPHTKSYFVLKATKSHKLGYWIRHKKYAESLTYNGVPGRLAIVRDKKTHNFIVNTFAPNRQTWIGLRFFCRYRKLMWVDGTIHPLKDFKIWHRQWFRNKSTSCSNPARMTEGAFMPVYYRPTNIGPVWQASGPSKGFDYALIEYPTGKE